MKIISWIIFAILFLWIHAEEIEDIQIEDEGAFDEPQREMSLEDQEKMRAVLNQMSPVCLNELKSAQESGSDVSEECKQQIQEITAAFENGGGSIGNNSEPRADPTLPILSFVFVLLAGMVGWGVYAQKNLVKPSTQVPKKLSKKKQEKKRRQQQQDASF